jgi:DNA-binding MurR/RpiR family transcriptional regulator
MEKLEKLNQEAKANGYKVIGMTNSAVEEIEKLNTVLLLTLL